VDDCEVVGWFAAACGTTTINTHRPPTTRLLSSSRVGFGQGRRKPIAGTYLLAFTASTGLREEDGKGREPCLGSFLLPCSSRQLFTTDKTDVIEQQQARESKRSCA
jgi:hypothetical protein